MSSYHKMYVASHIFSQIIKLLPFTVNSYCFDILKLFEICEFLFFHKTFLITYYSGNSCNELSGTPAPAIEGFLKLILYLRLMMPQIPWGEGGELPYKNDGGAHRIFQGLKFVDWYRLGCYNIKLRDSKASTECNFEAGEN